MIYPLLPIYLTRVLGVGAVSLGIIEGIAEGINSLLKVVSGWWSDRRGRRRPLVIAGYGLSGAARPLIAVAGSWVHVLIIRALDRTGKGIRGAPRDALLAQFADASSRGGHAFPRSVGVDLACAQCLRGRRAREIVPAFVSGPAVVGAELGRQRGMQPSRGALAAVVTHGAGAPGCGGAAFPSGGAVAGVHRGPV
jgi:hypothetical protein